MRNPAHGLDFKGEEEGESSIFYYHRWLGNSHGSSEMDLLWADWQRELILRIRIERGVLGSTVRFQPNIAGCDVRRHDGGK